SLLAAFPAPPAGGGRVLLPRAAVARDVLPDGLRAAGWQVDVVEAYRTVTASPTAREREAAATADVITFTASSTVERYLEVKGDDPVPPVVACIGPVTADTARAHGLTVDVVADEHTIPGLVAALVAHVGG
ncbi:MAG: uroporphyrinogen-III synthase, partial [Acidimicrobiales bacterium]|nr:uroporphyrinogen-III synthase [Acidimicrobiales bacterium]